MRVLIVHNLLWAHYKALIFNQLQVISDSKSNDSLLVIQLAATGKIHYFSEAMGVYRKHRGGLSNVQSSTNLYFLKNRKQMFAEVNEWLDFEYDSTIQETLKSYDKQMQDIL